VLESRPVLHEVLIAIFMVVATPVTYLLLVRAAMHRDGIDKAGDAPPRRKSG
jgi:multicomponent K+:H+ antiporter subunit G